MVQICLWKTLNWLCLSLPILLLQLQVWFWLLKSDIWILHNLFDAWKSLYFSVLLHLNNTLTYRFVRLIKQISCWSAAPTKNYGSKNAFYWDLLLTRIYFMSDVFLVLDIRSFCQFDLINPNCWDIHIFSMPFFSHKMILYCIVGANEIW